MTDWLGDTGVDVLLVCSCDLLVGAMVSAADACHVTVSLLMECVDDTFVLKDDDWPAVDGTDSSVEFEEKADVKGLDGDTESGNVELVKTPRKKVLADVLKLEFQPVAQYITYSRTRYHNHPF